MILTSADFGKKKEDEGLLHDKARPNVSKPTSEELAVRGLQMRRRLILPFAPMGKSQAAFYIDGEEVQLPLVDQEFVFPEGISEHQKDELTKQLEAAGFVDEGTVEKKPPTVLPKRFAHPDNAADHPVQLDKPLKFRRKRKGKRETVEVSLDEFGTVTTDDPWLQAKLAKDGWPEVTVDPGTKPPPEENPEEKPADTPKDKDPEPASEIKTDEPEEEVVDDADDAEGQDGDSEAAGKEGDE